MSWAGLAPVVVLALVLRQSAGTRWFEQLRGQAVPWLVAVGIPLAIFLWLRHRMLVEHVEPFGPYAIPYDHNPMFYMSALERLPSALMLLGYGLYKTLLPFSLSCSYRESVFVLPSSWFDLRVLAAGVVLLGGLFTALVSGARHPLLLVAVGAFFLLSFVTSNIPVAVETVFAERFYYAPSVGVALVVAWLATRVSVRGRVALAVPMVAWVALCTWKSAERSFQWRSDLALFEADVVTQPDSIDLRVNLAAQQLSNFGEAEAHANLRRALEIQPESTQALIQLAAYLTNSAAQLKNGNQQERARECLEEAHELIRRAQSSPRYVAAVDGRGVHVLLSRYHRELGHAVATV